MSAQPGAAGEAAARGLAKASLRFEENKGQTDSQVKFLARGPGYCCFLTSREAVLSLVAAGGPGLGQRRGKSMRLLWDGARGEVAPEGEVVLPGKCNYLLGREGEGQARSVDAFGRVRYREIYPGIDLLFYGTGGELEFDYVVRPGADLGRIAFSVEGALVMRDEATGDLRLTFAEGEVRLRRPTLYQEEAGERHLVEGRYALRGSRRDCVGFEVAAYDTSRELVIDPTILYSTYFGGTGGETDVMIGVDGSDNLYLCGSTPSSDFPTTSPLQSTYGGGLRDAFVVKFNPAGDTVQYATYLGGSDDDPCFGSAVDSAGAVYLVGPTKSTNYPMVNPFQSGILGDYDAYLAKLNPAGTALLYSTYLGGTALENIRSVKVNAAGIAWLAGMTASANFPTVSPSQAANGGGLDCFLCRFDTTASGSPSLQFSTYYGGSSDDMGTGVIIFGDLDVDSSGNMYVTGLTRSSNLPLTNALQSTLQGSEDAFVARFNSSGTRTFASYLGGTNADQGEGIAVDGSGNIYVAFNTASTDVPVTAAFQPAYGGGSSDIFLAKIDPAVPNFTFATYLGGASNEFPNFIRLDGTQVLLAGFTGSTNFPVSDALQSANAGGSDAVLVKFAASGASLDFSTYLGGTGSDYGQRVALNSSAEIILSGSTDSTDFPILNGVQASRAGGTDCFLARISLTDGLPVTSGTSATAIVRASNSRGTAPLSVDFDGSSSTGGGSNTISSFFWVFGDGLSTSTTVATVNHSYAQPGEYVASLQVINSANETSAQAHTAITVGDGQVLDGELFLSKAAYQINRTADDSDSLSLDGYCNPAGLPADLSGATLALRLNGEVISNAIPVTGRSRNAGPRAGAGLQGSISLGSGQFKISGKGLNLKSSLSNLTDTTSKSQKTETKVEVEIGGVAADTAVAKGVFETDFKSQEAKSATGKFSFLTLGAFSGFFKSLKTVAVASSTGSFTVTGGGPAEAEFATALAPTAGGTITVTIGGDGTGSGGAVMLIPVASLKQSGSGDATMFTYSKSLGEVAGLKKFQFSNAKKKWLISAENLSGTGIPAIGSSELAFDLFIQLSVPTSNGDQTFQTIVEIKRSTTDTGKWGR